MNKLKRQKTKDGKVKLSKNPDNQTTLKGLKVK